MGAMRIDRSGGWGPRGLERRVRATAATGLSAVAVVLEAAATVAGTIAKELRLTLHPEEPDHPVDDDVTTTRAGSADTDEPTVRVVPPAVGSGVDDAGAGRATDDGADDGGPSPWVDDVAADVAAGTVSQALDRLPDLTAGQLRAVERYERSRRQRVTLLRAVDLELVRRG